MSRPKTLTQIEFAPSYDSFEDSPMEDFLIPALNTSIRYERAAGYFSSAILAVLEEAFSDFAERGGKMRLVCSPILTPQDASTLERLSSEFLIDSLNRKLNNLQNDGLLDKPLELMAALISRGALTLKLAIPYDPSAGIFHQKLGVFTDQSGNQVAFHGSNNESVTGWMDMRNSENFNVFTSWRDDNDYQRVSENERRFEKMWADQYPGFDILDFSSALEFIDRRSTEDASLADIKGDVRAWYQESKRLAETGLEDGLYPYQRAVLEDWKNHDHEGIVCFATGAGKTRAAIAAINHWRSTFDKRVVVILVPTKRLQKQWLQELRSNPATKKADITLVGGDTPAERWQKALGAVTAYHRHQDDGITIAVNATAATEAFYSRVHWGGHILLVADEVHNLGAPGYVDLLGKISGGAVLGLSATPNRYNDDENAIVREVFGEDLKPVVDIPYAQELGVLVPYRYRFEVVTLSDEEESRYRRLSQLIGKASSEVKQSGSQVDESRLQVLRSQRANVLKNAEMKTSAAAAVIRREYRAGQSWLVFCNDTDQLTDLKSAIADLAPLDFHGGMEGDVDATLRLFEREGGILLSIHMMDEGIDIPSINHCLLVASSQNTRQFIQRRGRVLRADRVNPKGVAEIWDLLVVDDAGKAYVSAEVARAMEFGSMALNQSIVHDLKKRSAADAVIQ